EADQTIWQVEKVMKDAGDKITENDKAPVNAAIEKLRADIKGDDANAIRQALNNLQSAAHAMAQHVQRGGGPSPDGGGGAPGGHGPQSGPGGKDDVIDAEFEVKK